MAERLRELTALPESWKGVISDSASTACLVAMLAARERATDYSKARGGLQSQSCAAHGLLHSARAFIGSKAVAAGRVRAWAT